jgi:hypothetical protein
MAAHAASLPEKKFAAGDMGAYIPHYQMHIGGVTGLAARFRVLLWKQRP